MSHAATSHPETLLLQVYSAAAVAATRKTAGRYLSHEMDTPIQFIHSYGTLWSMFVKYRA